MADHTHHPHRRHTDYGWRRYRYTILFLMLFAAQTLTFYFYHDWRIDVITEREVRSCQRQNVTRRTLNRQALALKFVMDRIEMDLRTRGRTESADFWKTVNNDFFRAPVTDCDNAYGLVDQ
jgi:hypothetical protein